MGSLAGRAVAADEWGAHVWLACVARCIVAGIVARRVPLPFANWWRARSVALGPGGRPRHCVRRLLLPRLVTTSTIGLRLDIWQTSLSQWLSSPVVGLGPGSFARELVDSGYYATNVANVPHAHDAFVQLLLEGGLVGVAGLGLVSAAVIVGILRQGTSDGNRSRSRRVLGCVFDRQPDRRAVPCFPLVIWVAMAVAVPTRQGERRHRRAHAITMAAAAVVAVARLATLAAAWAHDRAAAAAPPVRERRNSQPRTGDLARSLLCAIPPRAWVWLQSTGDLASAVAGTRRPRYGSIPPTGGLPRRRTGARGARPRRPSSSPGYAARGIAATHPENALTLASY